MKKRYNGRMNTYGYQSRRGDMKKYIYMIIVALSALMFSGCKELDAWLGIHEYRVGASILEFSIPMRNGMKKAYEATITEDKITAYIDYDDYVAASGVFSPIVKVSPGAQVIPASGSIIDVSYDENGGRHPTITYQVISESDKEKGYILGGKVYTVKIERLENAVASITRVEMLQDDNPELKQNYIADIDQHKKSITFTVRYNDFWDVLRNTPAYLKISATDKVKIDPDPDVEVDMSDLTDFRYTVTSEDGKITYSYTLRVLILPETMNMVTEFKLWELDMSEEITAEIDQLTDTINVVFGRPHADLKGALASTDQHIADFYSIKPRTRIDPEVRTIGRIVGRQYRIPETPLKKTLVKSGAGGGGRMERRIEDALTIKAKNGDLRTYDLVFSRGLQIGDPTPEIIILPISKITSETILVRRDQSIDQRRVIIDSSLILDRISEMDTTFLDVQAPEYKYLDCDDERPSSSPRSSESSIILRIDSFFIYYTKYTTERWYTEVEEDFSFSSKTCSGVSRKRERASRFSVGERISIRNFFNLSRIEARYNDEVGIPYTFRIY